MGVLLIVFVLGFTGCDWIKSIFGMEEDDPKETTDPGTPEGPKEPEEPEEPVHLRLYVGVPAEGSTDGDGKTPESPLPTVQAALERVAAAYAVEDGKGAEVKPWPGKGESSKGKSAEIVIVGTITPTPTSNSPAAIPIDGDYPPLILSAPTVVGDATPGTLKLNTQGTLITVGAGVHLTLGGSLNLVGLSSISDNGDTNDNNASLVRVEADGNLTLADNAVIRGNGSWDGDYYSVLEGGGVYVASGGTFTMSGGEIRGNKAKNGGGVFIYYNGGSGEGNFAKTGGIISVDDSSDSYTGDAVFVGAGATPTVTREETAGAGVDLYWPRHMDDQEADTNWEEQSTEEEVE
jgi:hypothetical protein